MDRWEAAIEDFQRSQTLDSFSSVLHTAELTLKEDLAQYELDWFIQTLLSEPMLLLNTMSARNADDAWSKVVKDAYKLLSDIVESQYEAVQPYVDDIILECQKPLDARTRSHALHCLTSCVKRTQPDAIASQYIAELGQVGTCKAPLALLVGTICEYHPELVADQTYILWRKYLNLLECNKNSDLVFKSLLKGVWGLFKHFGVDIPVNEISQFYDKLSNEYLGKCENAVLPILRDYASLFKEKLASDTSLRRELWRFDDLTPLVPVYEEAASVLTTDQIQKIVRTEIAPKTRESYAKLKFTALRVCTLLHKRYGVCVDDLLNVDVYSLEFELRKEISYEVAEAVSWCVEYNMVNSEKLLQTAVMFYQNLPANKRKDIVVNGLLNAPADMMTATLNFLITETCQQEDTLLTYLPLWRDLFASQNIDKKRILFEKFMNNVLCVLENFLDESSGEKKIPDKLATLLTLTSHVLTLQAVEDYSSYQCCIIASKLVELTQECGLEACVVALARSAIPHVGNDAGIGKIYEMIQIDKCKDEVLLCESCLAIIHADKCGSDPNVVLKASEIIFSRKDAEPKTLSLALQKLEELMVKENNNLNNASVSKCIRLVNKLRSRKDMVGKDARVLQRDITIFLGKYLNMESVKNAVNSEDNMLIVNLKHELTLDLPNPIEGITYKMNLNRLLHLSITQENEDSLRMLLNIVCANLCNNNTPLLQVTLGRVVVSLCRATIGTTQPNVARLAAAAFCGVDATLYIMQQISEEKSPAVRRMLSDTIESILLKDPGSEANEKVLRAVYIEVCSMMKSNYSILKLGGLDITESLLTALKVNSHQTKLMLPTLLLLISNTNEEDSHIVFENASKLFTENIGLFSACALDTTINDLFKILLNPNQDIKKEKGYKDVVKSTLNFLRDVKVCSREIYRVLIDLETSSDSVKYVYLWSEIPKVFDVEEDEIKEVLDIENGAILERIFSEIVVENSFQLDAHLRFLNNYASVLLKFHSEATLEYISRLIEKFPQKYVKSHRKYLSECLTHCRQICQCTPDVILRSFEIWSDSLPVKSITEYIEKEKFVTEHALPINSLKIMLEIFRLKDPTSVLTTVSIFAKSWSKTILKLFANDHIRYYKKDVPFLSDILSVSLSFLTLTDVKRSLQEGHSLEGEKNQRLGVEFGRFFMPVFVKYLVRKPLLLVQDGMESCWVLVNDVVKWSVRKRWGDEQLENVLELVDQLWPTIESKASFKAKHTLLLDLSCLNVKLSPHSRPMRWVSGVVGSNDAKRDDRIALVTVLPGGEEYSETYRHYASLLPTRLSDMDGASRAALRALLDALAGNADMTLLDIVITLADGDETPGWWDEALASCMASLAGLPLTQPLLASLYTRCRSASAAVCQRLLVPLLRCSPSSVCEKFFASILKEVLEGLGSGLKAPSLHPEYGACVPQKTILLDILQVLFEKVPPSKIESPSSPIYENIQTDKPWHLAREVLRLCYKLRDKLITPKGASTKLSNICREFQYAAYKCMCACVCARRPDAHIYTTVFNVNVWNNIVDESIIYELPLKTEWNRQKIRKAVSIVTGGGQGARSSTRSLSRSRVFLRTLSENPLEYDLIDNEFDNTEIQDVELSVSSLNNHACAATLTALFQHSAQLSHSQWRSVLCEGLLTCGRNARWLLAEAICNSKEDLKAHASALRPGLLAVIADTAQESCNSLHINILNTLISWGGDISTSEIPHLNTTITSLMHTALNNITRTNIFRMLEEVLENMLKVYGSYIEGNLKVFEDRFDEPRQTKSCLKLMLRFVKNNVRIVDLLPWLLTKLAENHTVYRSEMGLLAEVIGIEISNSKEHEKVTAALKLKKVLEEIRKLNISNYVKMLCCSGICDVQQFRIIVDLTQKLPEADKKKCLRIISAYICAHPDAVEVSEIPANIRQMADQISVDRQFEELFTTPTQFLTRPAKRAKVDITSPILDTIGRNEKYIAEVLARLSQGRGKQGGRGKVAEKLCTSNMAVRFVECFYIAIYLPIKYQCGKTDLSVCTSEFFQILFSHLKAQENFKDKKLRDEPWTIVHPMGITKSRSKRMVGTLRNFSYTHIENHDYESEQGIDVQVSIDKILDTFVHFAKVTPEAAMELLTQLLRCLKDRGFDPRLELSHLLSTLLGTAPELVVVARECMDQLCLIDRFTETADELMKSTIGSEGEQLFKLLHEETRLRSDDPNLFIMGSLYKMDDISMSEDVEFSIEGLVSAFQKLSNWDEITFQERGRIEASLPVLWTDIDESKRLIDEYTVPETSGWFGQTVQLYRENRKDVMKWLRLIDTWPRRHYVVSAVVEAMQWRSADIDRLQMPCDIQPSDCLVEWAARLMLRTAYLSDIPESDNIKLSRSHELIWCERANERGLHNLALSVIKRNCVDLENDEILKWMEQKMLALTMMGFKLNDRSEMEKALNFYSSVDIAQFYKQSASETIIGINMLAMQLNYKLQSLSTSKVDDILKVVETEVNRLGEKGVTSFKSKNIRNVYETAVLYYDGLWNENVLSKDDILVKISECLGRLSERNTDGASVAAILLNRLDECDVISDKAAAAVLAKMRMLIPNLPPCYIEQLKAKLSLFPPQTIRTYGITELQGGAVLDMYKKCMSLLCNADYLLLQYCYELHSSLQSNDASKWDEIFVRMMRRIFQNEYAGTDYQALTKYQSTLDTIRAADINMRRIVLSGIIQDLKNLPARETVRLSHVCPSLADLGPQRGLERLLRLPAGVLVVKIEEELRVFTDSIRRPCVLCVHTSDGKRRRYLHKNEDLRADASVSVLTDAGTGYTVIPLSEDCGLIEFLEDHKRIRELIVSTFKIDDVQITRQAVKENELVLAPRAASVQNYTEICNKIPAHAVRSAIEGHSSSVQDFIAKKLRFLETLSDMTIVNWLFGLGDRHLQNILYSMQNGGVQCIDFGAIFQYGGSELPPARLTRNMLALCEPRVLESRLQSKLSSLRDSHQLILPVLKLAFRWMEHFSDKLVYMEGILKGTTVAHAITKDVLQRSDKPHRAKYIQLLDVVFAEHAVKDSYSVEEQVSSLLLQSTDPWILSVTRSGWEPWL